MFCLPAQAPGRVAALDGTQHRPLAEAIGKPVALIFITHDCPICNAYAPELSRIAKAYAKRDVPVELVYTEQGLSRQDATAHAKSYSYTGMKLFLDPKGTLAKACGATTTPEAAVYDERGRLIYLGRIDDQYIGFGKQRARVSSRDLRAALDAALSHQQIAHPRTTAVGCLITINPS